jgi:DNA-binding protein
MTESIVYVGNKPPMSYVLALLSAFSQQDVEKVMLKARGQAISRAVDVAEIARRRFLMEAQIGDIEIGSEQMPTEEGGTRGVSTISITLTKGVKTEAKATTEPQDISEIKGIGEARAEKLRKAGFSTVTSLANAEPGELSKRTGISEKISAKIIESAKGIQEQK